MIRIATADDRDRELWHTLMDLAQRSMKWTLIGARMIELLAAERGEVLARLSLDADVLADARARPNAVRGLSEILIDSGFQLRDPSGFGLGHSFVRGKVEIDVLAPEGLGPRSEEARTTVPPDRTVEVPGGTQALRRTERVEVEVDGRRGLIPRPNLLGGILLKARAVDVDDTPEDQRSDLALLLSMVEDPEAILPELSGSERGWLRRRKEMDDEGVACWRALAPEGHQRGLAALRILAGFELSDRR